MQPYFFPYIGYFQLIRAADTFVIYDDVNFIKQGWINRNRILLNNAPHYINLGLSGASSFKKIHEIEVRKSKVLKTIISSYKKAPYFSSAIQTIEAILEYDEPNLSLFLEHSLRVLAGEFGIKANIIVSSDITKNNELRGQDKIVELCKLLNAETYINAIGGVSLYDRESFAKEDIVLKFIKSHNLTYRQFTDDFSPWLSIIDVMMFNPTEKISDMLNAYELI